MRLTQSPQRPAEYYHALPKVDLHRHLEGSLRFETVRELARSHGMDLPPTAQLKGMVQIQEDEPLTFENFLSKFITLRLFYRSPEIIGRITREAIEDAATDNVRYLELRFTPVALSKAQDFPLDRVMDWVIEGAQQAEREFGVKTRLIASLNRHESLALGAQVSYLALERMDAGIVGIDLAGDEASYSAQPFKEIIDHARQQGLRICIHAGEWNSGENVAQAIDLLGAERIGHGIRVFDSPRAVALALERKTTFEVCVTSNYQSGAVSAIATHPFAHMLEKGLNVTINTDDPSISNISLSDEYRLACEVLGLSVSGLRQRVLAAAQAAFLPDEERQALVKAIAEEFPSE
ncbi:MAG TPA: adenosine deaminase [Anaerolineales bacterium]|nr:adenosine deaminase [Anaerolineales bacterium]